MLLRDRRANKQELSQVKTPGSCTKLLVMIREADFLGGGRNHLAYSQAGSHNGTSSPTTFLKADQLLQLAFAVATLVPSTLPGEDKEKQLERKRDRERELCGWAMLETPRHVSRFCSLLVSF